ncbi:hypothetical protein AQUCO_01300082v1 [Aquilegia coerulea]|uniref:Uncharacterized protein n=1 Tax=Aquilegia coerulea TaxID=218851 RepID=A0A2G5DZK7_AQUCA|nr:hypothetical protein AQUCO_01300082v1 [Aquilegia coerulea]
MQNDSRKSTGLEYSFTSKKPNRPRKLLIRLSSSDQCRKLDNTDFDLLTPVCQYPHTENDLSNLQFSRPTHVY